MTETGNASQISPIAPSSDWLSNVPIEFLRESPRFFRETLPNIYQKTCTRNKTVLELKAQVLARKHMVIEDPEITMPQLVDCLMHSSNLPEPPKVDQFYEENKADLLIKDLNNQKAALLNVENMISLAQLQLFNSELEKLNLIAASVQAIAEKSPNLAINQAKYAKLLAETLQLKVKIVMQSKEAALYTAETQESLARISELITLENKNLDAEYNENNSAIAAFSTMGPDAITLSKKYSRLLDQITMAKDDLQRLKVRNG